MHAHDHTSGRLSRCVFRAFLVFLSSSIVAVAAEPQKAGAPPAPPKTHVLFLGADIAVQRNETFLPLQDVRQNKLVLQTNGEPVEVHMDADTKLRISEVLKIASARVTIPNLKAEPAYTPARDPFLRFANAARVTSAMGDVSDSARAELNTAIAIEGIYQGVYDNASPETKAETGRVLAIAHERTVQVQAEAAATENLMRSQVFDTASQSARMTAEASQELYDAIRIAFEIVAERDLAEPYYAVIAEIRERGSKPGEVRKWIYVNPMDPLAAGNPRKVSVFRGGLPLGYILEKCAVHIYDRGEELATSISAKRVELTEDDVTQYRIVEYIGANKGRTVAGSLLTAILRGESRGRLTPAQMAVPYFVRVNKAGKVTAVFVDEAAKQPLQDPVVEEVVRTIRFKPALENGRPVESIVPFRFSELAAE